jgi:uncharacterized membrane protein
MALNKHSQTTTTAPQRKSPARWLLAAMALLLVAAGAVGAFTLPGFGKAEKVQAVNGLVTIPVAKVSDGKAHFYRYSDGNKEVSFFLLKASDGTLRSAFDACDACYREKKGYEQQGDKMVCRNCNMKFASTRIGPASSGGCNPSHLPHAISGANVTISAADLKAGTRYF